MVTDAADRIALWVAIVGPCTGLLGLNPRAIRSLTFVGATLSLFAALWLTESSVTAGGILRFGGLERDIALQVSPATALFLAVSAAIAALASGAALATKESCQFQNRWQGLLTTSVNLVLVLANPLHFAITYLAATLIFNAMNLDRPTASALRTVGALLVVSGLFIHSGRVDLGAAGAWRPSDNAALAVALLTFGILAPVIAWRSTSGEHLRSAVLTAIPVLLSAAAVVHFPTSVNDSAATVVAPIASAILVATWGFVALRSRATDEASAAFAGALHALAMLQWFSSRSSLAADLAAFAASACVASASQRLVATTFFPRLRRTALVCIAATLVLLAVCICNQVIQKDSHRFVLFSPQADRWLMTGLGTAAIAAVGASAGAMVRRIPASSVPENQRTAAIEVTVLAMLSSVAALFTCATGIRAIAAMQLASIVALLLAVGSLIAGVSMGRRLSFPSRRGPESSPRPPLFDGLIRLLKAERYFNWLIDVVRPRPSLTRSRLPSIPVCALLVAIALAAVLVFSTNASVGVR